MTDKQLDKEYKKNVMNQDIWFIKEILEDIKNNKVDSCYSSKQEMLDDLRGLVESVAELWEEQQ